MIIQVGKHIDQIYEDPNKVTVPISRPFMARQANKYVGWPPLIPLNCER